MRPKFEYGEHVRVVRTIRDDGTFPGKDIGDVLVREGSVGHVRNVGSYLQEHIIYAVHFFEVDRIVGCREEELMLADEPWVPTRFLGRDKVVARLPLAVAGTKVVAAGQPGEITKVYRQSPGGPSYEVNFEGRSFIVPESALELHEADSNAANAHC